MWELSGYRIDQWSTAGVLQVLPVILICNTSYLLSVIAIMTVLDNVLGGLLVGTYANSILYTLELVAVVQYYTASKRNQDSLPLQAMVYFTFIVDTVSTIAAYASVYLYTVTHWGDIKFIRRQYWPSTVSLVGTGITALIVQCFLIYRYWRMSQNNYVTPVLVLFMLAASGGFVWTIVSVHLHTTYAQRNKIALSVTIWASTSAATDIAIAIGLLWQLSRIKSSFKATQSLIHRLMASTIRTGTATSVFVVITLIVFLVNKQSNVPAGFAYCLGRIYTLTMLYNLNNRSSLRHGSTNTTDAHSGEISNTMNTTNGIYVHRTAAVHYGSSDDQDILDLPDRSKDDTDSFSARGKVSTLTLGP